jgi:hypothetical protein
MATTEEVKVYAFKAEAAIAQYSVVIAGAVENEVVTGDGIAATF